MELSLTDFVHLRGIEREALRITESGIVSTNRHPIAFGSKLTNKTITVDFSESSLEIITKPHNSSENALKNLTEISSFCARNMLKNELLLNASMPLKTTEDIINIADFGNSHSGQMKKIYRKGLALRYGKIMQLIAGIHYNFSFDQKLMTYLSKKRAMSINALYFSVINHYFDFMFLLPYLFGSSPICAKSSLTGKKPDYLDELDENYYIGEYATSLRMSDFGYQSNAQKNLFITYGSLDSYVKDLIQATQTPYGPFLTFGEYSDNSKRHQLNSNILQLENEYYSAIRPKQIVNFEERPAYALLRRGVGYLEVRLLDVNPFHNIGIDAATSYFTEALLMTCLMLPPKKYCQKTIKRNRNNLNKVVINGRNPNLFVLVDGYHSRSFQDIGYYMIDTIEKYAKKMGPDYLMAIDLQRQKLEKVEYTPSAQIMTQSKKSYHSWVIEQSKKHHQSLLSYKISEQVSLYLKQQARESQALQNVLEQDVCCDIEDYIKYYYNNFALIGSKKCLSTNMGV